MKLGPRLLIEIMKSLQDGIAAVAMGKDGDISGTLRELEVEVDPDNSDQVELSSYLELRKGGY
jgi:hypothetical protein